MTRRIAMLRARPRSVAPVLAGAVLALALLTAWPASAQDDAVLTGTLKSVHDHGTIRLGLRENSVPFSFTNRAGQPVGFSVDLCRAIAQDVANTLGQDQLEPEAPAWQRGIRIAYVPVAAEARLPMVVAGTIDLECGSTTANAERAKTVAFSPVFFLAGTKLLVPADAATASYQDLAGKTVAVGVGTTNADVLHRLAATLATPIRVTELASVNAGFEALAAGRADALASDDILLAGTAVAHPGADRFRIVGDYLSFEPYAIMFRHDDPAFAALVRQSFAHMADSGALLTLYNRWFTERLPNGQTLGLPISAQLAEMYRAMGQTD